MKRRSWSRHKLLSRREPPAVAWELDDDAVIAAAEAEKPDDDDPELELLVYGNVIRRKRSELIEAYDLDGFDNGRIINIAQKQMAADQRLAEAKEAADQRLAGTASTAPRAGEGSQGEPTDQSDAPRPDDADGLAPERDPLMRPDQASTRRSSTRSSCGSSSAMRRRP